jgi:hypothetical protein
MRGQGIRDVAAGESGGTLALGLPSLALPLPSLMTHPPIAGPLGSSRPAEPAAGAVRQQRPVQRGSKWGKIELSTLREEVANENDSFNPGNSDGRTNSNR